MTKENGRGRNWRAKYALKDDVNLLRGEFEHFVANDFAHLRNKVRGMDNRLWAILIASIAIPTGIAFVLIQFILGRLP